jgi:hypothetical protein
LAFVQHAKRAVMTGITALPVLTLTPALDASSKNFLRCKVKTYFALNYRKLFPRPKVDFHFRTMS